MRRFVPIILGLALLALTSRSASAGTTMPNPGFQMVSGPAGYQFEVPSAWYLSDYPELPRGLDAKASSSDGMRTAAVAATPAGGLSPSDFTSAGAAEVVKIFSGGLTGTGASSLNVFRGPDSVSLAGADAAISFAGTFATGDGSPNVTAVTLALRGQQLYFFALRAPEGDYSTDPSFQTILDSFQLTAPALSADLATLAPSFLLSAEEAVIAIRPYMLTARDVLPGFVVSSRINADDASSYSLSTAFPSRQFQRRQSDGFIVLSGQHFGASGGPGSGQDSTGLLVVDLFANSDDARAFVTGETSAPASDPVSLYTPITLHGALGEASSGGHWTVRAADAAAEGQFELRWQRVQLAFVLETPLAPAGQEQQQDAEDLAEAIDRAEQTRPLSPSARRR